MAIETQKDPMELLERLAARARLHAPETPSVADDVIRLLRRREHSPLVWLSAGAMLAAALALLLIGLPQTDLDALDLIFEAAHFVHEDGGF